MTVVEACVVSLAEAEDAVRAGATRLELCSDLEEGGLSPDPSLVARVIGRVEVPVMVMVRPRGGGFRMTGREISTMVREVEACAAAGVGGVVLGVLGSNGRVDAPALSELLDAAGSMPVTFHRAFDALPRPVEAIDVISDAGVARVLTSGGAESAWEGRASIRRLIEASAGRVEILAGGRVRGGHVNDLVAATGVREVHARASAIPGIVQALSRLEA